MKILKRDVLGRVTVTREQREALLDEFERGGLKGKPFARLVGVSYPTFASWIQQRRHARGDYARLAALSPKPPAAKLLPAPRAVRLMEALVSAAPTPEPAAVAPGIGSRQGSRPSSSTPCALRQKKGSGENGTYLTS